MRYAGEINELVRYLPQFAKVPCLFDRFENPYSDLIVRLPPTQSEPVVPVAMVSKGYALISSTMKRSMPSARRYESTS